LINILNKFIDISSKKVLIKPCNTLDFESTLKNEPKLIDYIEEIIKKHNLIKNLKRITENYMVISKNYYPFDVFGDGLKQFLNICIRIKDLPVVLLDEPTAFMHPGYTREFVSFLINYSIKNNKQVFISTHDIDLIESILIFEDHKNDMQFVRLLKNDYDEIISETYNFDDAKEEIETFKLDLRGI
jgi:AAA15 family ATPase/GTPase